MNGFFETSWDLEMPAKFEQVRFYSACASLDGKFVFALTRSAAFDWHIYRLDVEGEVWEDMP